MSLCFTPKNQHKVQANVVAALHLVQLCVCNCSISTLLQVMSHNKERRSKRDEKLDKKSQAMEELKAEREKKKNKTGWCDFTSL